MAKAERVNMTCEKLLHGNRANKPFPQFHTVEMVEDDKGDDKGVERPKKKPIPQPHFPYKCERTARKYKVSGTSFTAFAVLCKSHAKAAQEKEGFTLQEVEA